MVHGALKVLVSGLLIAGGGQTVFASTTGRPSPIESASSNTSSHPLDKKMAAFFAKDKVTILVTDSGLGGLSVAAEIEKEFQSKHPFQEVKLIFVNALASKNHLYNQMENTAEKVRVFNNALYGMTEQFNPDLILIACNTLSVIFDQTEYYKKEVTPVLGIVRFGVNLMSNAIKSQDDQVIIVGTPTTISQNTHWAMLVERGISANRITAQSCPMLESEIQNNPNSDMVSTMIEMFADEALEEIGESDCGELSVGLCCTHYTYSAPLFKEIFDRVSGREVTILDPNRVMSAYLFENGDNTRFDTTTIAVQVVSQAEIISTDINAIAGMLKPVSPAFADALKNYKWMKTLFRY